MKFTNKLNLPQALVDAVKNDGYFKGDADISVTELLDPPQMRYLRRKHEKSLVEDVSSRIFSLLGQVIHGILERASTKDVAERRLSINVLGWSVSGGMDNFVVDAGIIQDYKLTTLYKIKDGKIPEEWVKQLNIYAEIMRQNSHTVNGLQVVALLRDWSKGMAQREEGCPQQQVVVIDIPLIPSDEVKEYINQRVSLHQQGEKGMFPECSKEERWERGECWALMKDGQKRAIRLYDSKENLDPPRGMYIQHRKGISIRCNDYCLVKDFCTQYKNNKGETKND